MSQPNEEHKLIRKLGQARDKQKSRPWPLRVLVVLAGATVLLAGLIMLITPGPAFAVIPVGLFILALEFVWAETALSKAIHKADQAKQAAKKSSPAQRFLLIGALVLAAGSLVTWALMGDVPLLPY